MIVWSFVDTPDGHRIHTGVLGDWRVTISEARCDQLAHVRNSVVVRQGGDAMKVLVSATMPRDIPIGGMKRRVADLISAYDAVTELTR